MKRLTVAPALLALWLSLNAEGSSSLLNGPAGPERTEHPPEGRIEQAKPHVERDKNGKVICKSIYSPMPLYPRIAWVRNEGSGLFLLSLRPNGTVSAVAVERSTEYRELDAAAIKALKQWRFQAEASVTQVRIPINFRR